MRLALLLAIGRPRKAQKDPQNALNCHEMPIKAIKTEEPISHHAYQLTSCTSSSYYTDIYILQTPLIGSLPIGFQLPEAHLLPPRLLQQDLACRALIRKVQLGTQRPREIAHEAAMSSHFQPFESVSPWSFLRTRSPFVLQRPTLQASARPTLACSAARRSRPCSPSCAARRRSSTLWRPPGSRP